MEFLLFLSLQLKTKKKKKTKENASGEMRRLFQNFHWTFERTFYKVNKVDDE